jgi:hypothetical protein
MDANEAVLSRSPVGLSMCVIVPPAHSLGTFLAQGVINIGMLHLDAHSPSNTTSIPRWRHVAASLRAPSCPALSACAYMVTTST